MTSVSLLQSVKTQAINKLGLTCLTADVADMLDNEDVDVFQISLQVPVGGALDNLKFPSDIS